MFRVFEQSLHRVLPSRNKKLVRLSEWFSTWGRDHQRGYEQWRTESVIGPQAENTMAPPPPLFTVECRV